MKLTKPSLLLVSLLLLFAAVVAQAATVSGTVTDMTTNKPAAGDQVTLLEPMSGMSEVGHATTNAQGRYTLDLPGQVPYLVRVTHQGAEYFIAAPQGGGTGDISVYDVAAKVEGITIAEHVTGIETDNGQLRVVERYDIHNASSPPRTQWSKQSFQVILPADAVIGDASAQRPGASSLPTSVKLNPDGPKGHYSFDFPIQPDQDGKGTLFQIQYNLPYGDSKYTFHSQTTLPADTVWVVLPKSMTFTGGSGSGFESSPQDPSVQTFLSRNVSTSRTLEFSVAGTGSFARDNQNGQGGDTGGQGAAPGNQPGGGIGEPINTPDPLSKYKWWILGGVALLLVIAAGFLLRKPAGAGPDAGAGATAVSGVSSAGAARYSTPLSHGATTTPAAKNTALLNVLKEELFALESEKIAGTLPAGEYAEQKAALETVLKRALKKQ
ncbi:MAG TPA: carboxypeptidase-like regulatory domain-containing protein [Terracidiphilus sp.]|nr:carboxypeptidase-like regulatory domain-containing protein [Terracidiphilus sp.]